MGKNLLKMVSVWTIACILFTWISIIVPNDTYLGISIVSCITFCFALYLNGVLVKRSVSNWTSSLVTIFLTQVPLLWGVLPYYNNDVLGSLYVFLSEVFLIIFISFMSSNIVCLLFLHINAVAVICASCKLCTVSAVLNGLDDSITIGIGNYHLIAMSVFYYFAGFFSMIIRKWIKNYN